MKISPVLIDRKIHNRDLKGLQPKDRILYIISFMKNKDVNLLSYKTKINYLTLKDIIP